MEGAPRGAAVHDLDAADLDDPVPELRLKPRRLGVEDDLPHRARVYRKPLCSNASMASLARRSTRSLPSTPACPGTQCHSMRCGAASRSSSSHRSWFLTGFLSAVRQPRAFHEASHSVMPRRTYSESV